MLETEGGLRILIDCGPDFRQQILRYKPPYATPQLQERHFFDKIDAVLFTHIHYDHVGGADDLRAFARWGDMDIYAQQDVVEGLHSTMPYCFKEQLYPGVPHLKLHRVKAGVPFVIERPYDNTVELFNGGSTLDGQMFFSTHEVYVPAVADRLEVLPVSINHGSLPILGFRIGDMAYITDMKSITPENLQLLRGIEVLVVNALRFEKEHHSHQLVADAVAMAQELGAKRTYLTHLTHDIGTHDSANARLPKGVEFAYDGQVIEC